MRRSLSLLTISAVFLTLLAAPATATLLPLAGCLVLATAGCIEDRERTDSEAARTAGAESHASEKASTAVSFQSIVRSSWPAGEPAGGGRGTPRPAYLGSVAVSPSRCLHTNAITSTGRDGGIFGSGHPGRQVSGDQRGKAFDLGRELGP